MSRTLAPRALRMPISLVRRSAEKEARPNRPRQAMRTAKAANTANIWPRCSSASYWARRSSSTKELRIGTPAAIRFQMPSTASMVSAVRPGAMTKVRSER